ncbi:hypothetical protein KA005_28845 [bacterium]|nr:hypothetical protein [bacterium]
MSTEKETEYIIACPYCPDEVPHNFLECDPKEPDIVICAVHGRMKINQDILNGPRFCFSHYEMP